MLIAPESERKQKTAILSWLSPLQMNQSHQTIAARAENGSGRWFLNSEQFLAWKSGDNNLLWCPGIRLYHLFALTTFK